MPVSEDYDYAQNVSKSSHMLELYSRPDLLMNFPLNLRDGEADKISRLDSYEQLNDVKFEGFSSLGSTNSSSRKSKSDKGTNTLNRRTVAVRECRVMIIRYSDKCDSFQM